ncbi:Heat shock transcription factor [Coemansia furcata]|uniref:Heat shock transcription factor n=1 Tax=Coemansia furcata TaxID=417177 RepID=A0ACC1L8W1_9FUNG|nr:Heat shock transcription factor [Coemansia furcata]
MSGTIARRGNPLHRSITVTPFLNKLLRMVDDDSSDDLIRWSEDGSSFVVLRHEEFAKEVLPRFFKHCNFSSFVRQLNMYDFHKVPHLQQGGLIADGPEAESWEFSNPNFQRGQPDLLHFIRRKKGTRDTTPYDQDSNGVADEESLALDYDDDDEDGGDVSTRVVPNSREKEPNIRANSQRPAGSAQTTATKARASRTPPATLTQILKEIQVIRDHQMTISSDIKRLQEENQSLWIQASTADERHKQHQNTIDNILQFLATVFRNESRPSEIRPPLHRLITNSSSLLNEVEDGSDNDAHAYLGQSQQRQKQRQQKQQQRQSNLSSGSATPMVGANGLGSHTQEIFENMGFADMLDEAQQRQPQPPPGKRPRLSPERTSPERGSRIFEMSSSTSSPAEPANRGSPQKYTGNRSATQRIGGDGSPATLRRKVPSPQSTALTRNLYRPVITGTQQPPQIANAAMSNALVSVTGTPLSTIKTQSKTIEQLQQEIDSLGLSLDHLTQQLQSGANRDATPDPLLSAQLSSFGAAAATPTMSASVADMFLQSLPSSKADLNALLTPEALNSLAMSLAVPSTTLSTHGFDATMLNGFDKTSMFQGNPPTAAPVYGPSVSASATNGIYDNHSAPNGDGVFEPNWLIEMLRTCTPAQYESLQNYFKLISPSTGVGPAAPMHTATDNGVGSNSSPIVNADLTPFLDFVDPTAAGDVLAGFDTNGANFFAADDANISTEDGKVGHTAVGSVDDDYTKILLDALNSDPAIVSSAIDAFGHGSQDAESQFSPATPTSILANDLAPVSESAKSTARTKSK